uniref:Sugar phosphate transporter domain-containing protein n=2 Tax=Lotharella globosa TaxID=91324 RepID=A0A7S3YQ22_9EUKA
MTDEGLGVNGELGVGAESCNPASYIVSSFLLVLSVVGSDFGGEHKYRYSPPPEGSCGGLNTWVSIAVAVPCSAAATFYNKWLLHDVPYPILATLGQLFVLTVSTQVARHTTGLFTAGDGAPRMTWGRFIFRTAPISILLATQMIMSNFALGRLPVTLFRMLASTQLVWFTLGMILFGFEPNARSSAVHFVASAFALVLICISTARNSQASGVMEQLCSSALFSLQVLLSATNMTEERALEGNNGLTTPLSMPAAVCHAAPGALIIVFLIWICSEAGTTDWDQVYEVGLPAVFFNGFLCFASMLCDSVVQASAPLPLISIANAASDSVVVLGGTLVLHEKIGWGSVVGLVAAWATSLLYRRAREDTDPQAHSPAWQRRDWVSQDRVSSMVETGDLILFTSTPSLTAKGIGSAGVRIATFSCYDHVALVLKTQEGDVFLIEALAEGASVNDWHYFQEQGWHEDYSRIVLRRLTWPAGGRNGAAGGTVGRGTLSQFADGIKGRRYALDLCGLLFGTGWRSWEDPERTFSCSEIVAEGYKFLGLLPPKTCAARFVPGDFAEGRHLGLPHGASLGKEVKIYFPGRWDGFEQAAEFVMRSF